VLFSALAPRGETAVIEPPASVAPVASGIFVHILGAVASPGLYELRDGDRAVDAIAAAGGFTDDADQTQLNLARFVSDGEQIIVPVVGAEPPVAAGVDAGGKVNLNTADQADLESLPRIGPAMAQRILAWRDENGRFTSVEDLLSVTGVGEKTFEGLKDLVTV
jgi:competence protein ComEA